LPYTNDCRCLVRSMSRQLTLTEEQMDYTFLAMGIGG